MDSLFHAFLNVAGGMGLGNMCARLLTTQQIDGRLEKHANAEKKKPENQQS
jgi:hypothetical protein